MRTGLRTWIALSSVLLGAPSGGQDAATRSSPAIEYRVACDEAAERLRVEVRVTGLDPAGRDVWLELPGWGEWYDLDEYYVTRLTSTPPIRRDHESFERFRPDLPAAWDGTITASYEIPIVSARSRARQSHGLLPWRGNRYVHAFTANTLMRVVAGETRQDANRTLVLLPPAAWRGFTGWRGFAKAGERLAIPPDGDNTLLILGAPSAATQDGADAGVEVAQFGMHEDRVRLLRDLALKVRAAYESSTGAPPPCVARLVVTEPGMGGTHVEGAITIGHPGLEDDGRPDVGTYHFLAHEMFHSWLPGVLKRGEPGLEWFFEGFTEYFSLWHLVGTGHVTAQQFGDRLRMYDILVRSSPAFGSVRFADPAVKWREQDAETVAYKGGALLAFHLDAGLRAAGKPGLPMLFRDLVRTNGSRYTLEAIRRWIETEGPPGFWKDCCETGRLPDAGDALVRIGFTETREGENRIVKGVPAATGAFFRFSLPR